MTMPLGPLLSLATQLAIDAGAHLIRVPTYDASRDGVLFERLGSFAIIDRDVIESADDPSTPRQPILDLIRKELGIADDSVSHA